jgi:hypothetical protein
MNIKPNHHSHRVLETLNQAAHLYRATFRQVFVIAFITALLNQLLSLYFLNTFILQNENINLNSPWGFGLSLFLMLFVILFGNSLILVRQNAHLKQEPLEIKGVFQRVLQRFPGILVSGIIFAFLSLLGLALYIIPGLIFMTLFCVYLPSLLFAHKKAFESWIFSFRLIKPHFLGSFGIVLINLILLWIPPELTELLGFYFNSDGSLYGLEVTVIVFVIALILPMANAITLAWFYKLQQPAAPKVSL